MTPKNKSKMLVNKYLKAGMMINLAKKCASICIDEILSNTYEGKYNDTARKYWLEVKTEIKKQ